MSEKTARILYLLSEEGRKKSLLSGGNGKATQDIETEITPEILSLASVDSDGNTLLQVGFTKNTNYVTLSKSIGVKYLSPGWEWEKKIGGKYFDEPQTVEALIAWEHGRVKGLHDAENDPENLEKITRLVAEFQAKKKAEEVAKAERETKCVAEAAEAKAKKEQVEAERAAWIAEFGSDYLQRATKLGYNCQRQYVTERALSEFPGYEVDFDDRAKWNSRACPSVEALFEVESLVEAGHEAEVIWLTCFATDEAESNYPELFDPCEAIVVRHYLGKYDLVKIV